MPPFELEAHAERLRHHLEQEATRLPGIQYAMTLADELPFEFCGGWRDLGARSPVTPTTTFMAASCTKAVTAAAVHRLVGGGKVALDASLSSYYPDHPYGSSVTIRHLLNQTSGVPNPMPLNWLHRIDDTVFNEDRAIAEVLRANPRLRFPAGDRYAYSNLSYWLLGKVIEKVSGQRFADYLAREIFAPLGANPAELSLVPSDTDLLARGYQRQWTGMGLFIRLAVRSEFLDGSEGGWLRFARVAMNGPPYGGIVGSARGFCRFLQDQLRGRSVLFDQTQRALFLSEQRDAHGRVLPTTLGWHRGQVAGVTYYGKPGGGPGYHGNIRIYPDKGIATAWFANATDVSEGSITQFSDAADRHWLE